MSKAIPDYEGVYTISEDGEVSSSRRSGSKGGVRLSYVDKDGYKRISLSKDGESRNKLVHHLVAETYLGVRADGMCVCHKDGDKTNNNLDNLYYGTYSDNSNDAVKHGTHNLLKQNYEGVRLVGDDCPWSKLDEDKVRYIKRMKGHKTCRVLAEELNVTYGNISAIWCGRSWRDVA